MKPEGASRTPDVQRSRRKPVTRGTVSDEYSLASGTRTDCCRRAEGFLYGQKKGKEEMSGHATFCCLLERQYHAGKAATKICTPVML